MMPQSKSKHRKCWSEVTGKNTCGYTRTLHFCHLWKQTTQIAIFFSAISIRVYLINRFKPPIQREIIRSIPKVCCSQQNSNCPNLQAKARPLQGKPNLPRISADRGKIKPFNPRVSFRANSNLRPFTAASLNFQAIIPLMNTQNRFLYAILQAKH